MALWLLECQSLKEESTSVKDIASIVSAVHAWTRRTFSSAAAVLRHTTDACSGAQPLPWACVHSTCAGRLMPVPGQRSASCTGCGNTVEAVTLDAFRKELHSAREMLKMADQNICTLTSAMRQTAVALSILRRVLHRHEREIGCTADRLACLFASSGRWEEASNACAVSVEVVSYCFGECGLETALERCKLAKLLHNAG